MMCTAWNPFRWLLVILSPLPVQAADPLYFEKEVSAIIRQNCLACHFSKKAEGGLNLESFRAVKQGSDSGEVYKAGDPDHSLLIERVSAEGDAAMPPPDNTVGAKPLTKEEIEVLRRWIAAGGLSDGSSTSTAPPSTSVLPDTVQASYALELSPDGEWVVYSKGNDLVFRSLVDGSPWFATSPDRAIQLVKDAHQDACFSLAVSPDGQRIASGSTGEVRIWRREYVRRLMSEEEKESGQPPQGTGPSSPAANAAIQSEIKLTAGGEPISKMLVSPSGQMLATINQSSHLQLWSMPDAQPIQDRLSNQLAVKEAERIGRDVERQKKRLERADGVLAERTKTLESEQKGLEAAKEAQTKATEAWKAKDAELQALLPPLTELEKKIQDLQSGVDIANQELVESPKAGKEEAAPATPTVSKPGVQALLELGRQRLDEWKKEAEPKRKQVDALQLQVTDLKGKMESSIKGVELLVESLALAKSAVEQQQQLLKTEKEALAKIENDHRNHVARSEERKVAVRGLAISPDDRFLVILNDQQALEVIQIQPFQRVGSPLPVSGNPTAIRFDDNRRFHLLQEDGKKQHWELTQGWSLEGVLDNSHGEWISDRVNALAFSVDSDELAIGSGWASRSGHLTIVELGASVQGLMDASKVKVRTTQPELHSDTLLSLAYSPDGRLLASGGSDKMVKLINTSSLEVVRTLEGHTHHVLGVAWQQDGYHLASSSSDGTLKIWDAERGEAAKTVTTGNELTDVSFVGDSSKMVSSSLDRIVRLNDAQTNDQPRSLGSSQDALYAVTASPDGRYVIAVGQEGIPRRWKIEDGKLDAEWKTP